MHTHFKHMVLHTPFSSIPLLHILHPDPLQSSNSKFSHSIPLPYISFSPLSHSASFPFTHPHSLSVIFQIPCSPRPLPCLHPFCSCWVGCTTSEWSLCSSPSSEPLPGSPYLPSPISSSCPKPVQRNARLLQEILHSRPLCYLTFQLIH